MLEPIISDDSVFSVISTEFPFSRFSTAAGLDVGTGVVFFEVDGIIDFVSLAWFDLKIFYAPLKTQNNYGLMT